MASQLRLTGTNGGNTILSGNDSIDEDQTFEFPNVGGTLLTGSQTETGSGGSSGSAQVVGYQQGAWTPIVTFGGTAGTPTTTTTGGWTRIGGQVTLWSRLLITALGGATGGIQVTGVPYPVQANFTNSTALQGYGSVVYLEGSQNTSYLPTVTLASNGEINFRLLGTGVLSNNHVDAGFSMRFFVTYVTNNTTWAPSNSATVS